MLRQPWFNWGLWLGDDDKPTDDNVVFTPEAFYRATWKTLFKQWNVEDIPADLSLRHRRMAWKMLGHTGPPPRMRLVLHMQAVKEALDEVLKQPEWAHLKRRDYPPS